MWCWWCSDFYRCWCLHCKQFFLMPLLLLLLLFEQLQKKMACYTIWYFIEAKCCCCWLTLIFFFYYFYFYFINFSPCNMKVYHQHTYINTIQWCVIDTTQLTNWLTVLRNKKYVLFIVGNSDYLTDWLTNRPPSCFLQEMLTFCMMLLYCGASYGT